MDIKKLNKIKDQVRVNFVAFPVGLKLDGMDRALTHGDIMAICYYRAIVSVLTSEGHIKEDSKLDFDLLEEDSNPKEEDYYG